MGLSPRDEICESFEMNEPNPIIFSSAIYLRFALDCLGTLPKMVSRPQTNVLLGLKHGRSPAESKQKSTSNMGLFPWESARKELRWQYKNTSC